MVENFIQDILKYAEQSDDTKDAVIHWFWSNIERRRKMIFRQYFEQTEFTTIEEYGLLNLIALEPNVTLTKATKYLYLERSTTSEIIKRFERKKWIKIEPSLNDKRVKYFQLTKLGESAIVEANQIMLRMNNYIFGELGAKNDFLVQLREIFNSLDLKNTI